MTASELIVGPPNEFGLYPVQSGENTYWVDPETAECSCPHYTFRCAFHRDQMCKHAVALAAHLKRLGECPACHGQGTVELSGLIRYVLADGPSEERSLPCCLCEGTGRRTAAG